MAAPRGSFDWTDEAIEKLRQLWAEGESLFQIGLKLRVSKNSIAGKAHRLGLPARPSPIKRGGVPKTEKPLRGNGSGRGHALALPAGAMLKVVKLPAYLAPPAPKSLGPVTKCCFPIGFPKQPGFRFCGAVSEPGYPYCGPHCSIAYVPLKKWCRQNAISARSAELSVDL